MLKIVRAVELVAQHEPEFNLSGNGDIDFNKLSDGTLSILHQFLFSNQPPLDLDEEKSTAVNQIAPVNQFEIEIDALAKWFKSNWFNVEKRPDPELDALVNWFNEDWSNLGKTTKQKPTAIASVSQRSPIQNDSTVKIEMPNVLGQPKTTFIFTKEVWQNLCSTAFWQTNLIRVILKVQQSLKSVQKMKLYLMNIMVTYQTVTLTRGVNHCQKKNCFQLYLNYITKTK